MIAMDKEERESDEIALLTRKENFQLGLKKIKVKDAFHDLYEPKRILGLLFGYLTGIAEDNKAKIDELKSALQYAKELAEGLKDDEWTRWLHWMRNCFKYGTIGEHWKQTQSESWFDPSFQVFVNKELIPEAHKNNGS
jgi:hypothetical protein